MMTLYSACDLHISLCDTRLLLFVPGQLQVVNYGSRLTWQAHCEAQRLPDAGVVYVRRKILQASVVQQERACDSSRIPACSANTILLLLSVADFVVSLLLVASAT